MLAEHEGVGFMADTEMDIRAAPARHLHTAWAPDQDKRGGTGSCLAKRILRDWANW